MSYFNFMAEVETNYQSSLKSRKYFKQIVQNRYIWQEERKRERCTDCKYRIRSANHRTGSHCKSKGKVTK